MRVTAQSVRSYESYVCPASMLTPFVVLGRNDAYLNNGDAHSLNITKFELAYALGGTEDRYTLDKFRIRFHGSQAESVADNPYYFTGAFSTFLVAPAAYNFVIVFMSNHTDDEPSGYLDGGIFKSFFGVTGEPGSFVWNRGQERVPDNWVNAVFRSARERLRANRRMTVSPPAARALYSKFCV